MPRTSQCGMAQHGERFGGIERTPFFFVIAAASARRSSVWLCFTRSRLPIPARNPRQSSAAQPELLPQKRTPASGRCRAGRTAFLSLHSHRVLRWRTPQTNPSLLFMTATSPASNYCTSGWGASPQSVPARLSLLRLASSPEYRLCGRSLRIAIPRAFFCPISTSSRLPRVIPV